MATDVKRVRSPNYPQIGLSTAIVGLKKVWDRNHKAPARRDVIVSALGYKGYNGASAGVLSALIKFGLLEREGEEYRVTTLGRSILTPSSEQERAKAIKEAAHKPVLFNQLVTKFDGVVPTNDDLLRSYLINKDFSPNTVPQVIQYFRETFELVEREGASYDTDSFTEEEEIEPVESASTPDARRTPDAPPPTVPSTHSAPAVQLLYEGERQILASQLSGNSSCRIVAAGPVGPKELRYLQKLLELQAEMLSDECASDGDEVRRDN